MSFIFGKKNSFIFEKKNYYLLLLSSQKDFETRLMGAIFFSSISSFWRLATLLLFWNNSYLGQSGVTGLSSRHHCIHLHMHLTFIATIHFCCFFFLPCCHQNTDLDKDKCLRTKANTFKTTHMLSPTPQPKDSSITVCKKVATFCVQ